MQSSGRASRAAHRSVRLPCENDAMDPVTLRRELEATLSGGHTSKILRFLLNVISATPFVGGVFSAAAAAWSEQEQNKISRMLLLFQKLTDDKVSEVRQSLVSVTEPQHVVAGSITFNPNTAELVASSAVSSLTDHGVLDFTVNFSRPFQDYVFMCYGSGPVVLKSVEQTPTGMRVLFEHPAPDKVTIAFFEQQPNPRLEGTR